MASDTLLRLILLWSIFLPLGSVFSLDSKSKSHKFKKSNNNNNDNKVDSHLYSGVASYALITQMSLMYFTTSLWKNSSPEWTESGDALYYILYLDKLVTPFGAHLRAIPNILPYLRFSSLFAQKLEFFAGFMFWFPFYNNVVRVVAVVLLIGMHVGIGLTMHVGLFYIVPPAILISLLPSSVWDVVFNPILQKLFKYDATTTTCIIQEDGDKLPQQSTTSILLPVTNSNPYSSSDPESPEYYDSNHKTSKPYRTATRLGLGWMIIRSYRRLFIECFVLLLLGNTIMLNITQFDKSESHHLSIIPNVFRLTQTWDMFAGPPKTDDWWSFEGILVDNSIINAWHNGEEDEMLTRKTLTSQMYKNSRWSKFFRSLTNPKYIKFGENFCEKLCQEWNKDHAGDKRMDSVEAKSHIVVLVSPEEKMKGGEFLYYMIDRWYYKCKST